ncbi:DUF2071 domain-containing protein [soil metagenome]
MTEESPPNSDSIDRVAPTIRPDQRVVMYQCWRHLLFLHWAVPVEAVRKHIPPGLEVDTFEGQAYVGLIPFTMKGVRPPGMPAVPWLSRLHEVNVRTYVHCKGKDPGVWFFSLDASQSPAVIGARVAYRLPYFRARMRMKVDSDKGPGIDYTSERLWPGPKPATCSLRYGPRGEPGPAAVGTLDHFLVERYLLYTGERDRLYRGRVHHAPYPLQGGEVLNLKEDLLASAGIERPDQEPIVHYVSGVDVEIFPLERVHESPAPRTKGSEFGRGLSA